MMSLVVDDGLCVVSPELTSGELSAIETDHDVGVGAARVLRSCVYSDPNYIGGSARSISKYF